MNRQEHLMTIAMEECDETSQRIAKANRFGMQQVQPGHAMTNRERIKEEFDHLIAALRMLGIDTTPDEMAVRIKMRKVERYLAFSSACGTLSETAARNECEPSASATQAAHGDRGDDQ